jgi:putative endonuclease
MKKLCKLKISPYKSGYLAEFICRMFMRLHGYRIIAKNYRCGTGKKTPYGELDFVAIKGMNIVFCEVKKRQNDIDFSRALSYKQQERILNGGQYFMRAHPKYKKYSMRFDVFFIKLPFSIKWLKNAIYRDRGT